MELIEEKKIAINRINLIQDLGVLKSINELLDTLPIDKEIFEKHKKLILNRINGIENNSTFLMDWDTVQDEL